MRQALQKAVGSEAKILANFIQNIDEVLGRDQEEILVTSTAGATEALNKLKFLFRAFVRTICSNEISTPVVLFLDDLQWADSSVLDLVETIVKDSDVNHSLLFIGGYRGNEVDEGHPLTAVFHDIAGGGHDHASDIYNQDFSHITKIQLSDLDLQDVNEIVASLTGRDITEVQPLAGVVFRKTNGNVFFSLQFLKHLKEEGLLRYSFVNYKWEWDDIETIEMKTEISENVADVVAANIRRLPGSALAVIKIAACFHSTFNVDLLDRVMRKVDYVKGEGEEALPLESKEEISKILYTAEKSGLVLRSSNGRINRFRLSHDKIQSGAYSLINEGQDRDLLHCQIGIFMKEEYESANRQDWMLFEAANHMNMGSTCVKDKVGLARLNLQAAEQAITYSAFVPASKFLAAGIKMLEKKDPWGKQYDLNLRLYSAAAEMAFCNGKLDDHARISAQVLSNFRSSRDAMRVYASMVDVLGSQKQHQEAADVALMALEELGERFPKRPSVVHIIYNLLKTKRKLRGKTDNDLLTLPTMTNQDKIEAMKLLKCCTTHVYILQNMEMFALILFRMMQLSLKYGLSIVSPLGFASYGVMLRGVAGDIDGGYRFGKLALQLVELLNAKETESQVLMVTNIFLNHWKQPLQDSIEPLLRGHQVGMEAGDTEYALYCANIYLQLYFYTGLPLAPFERDLRDFCGKMDEYNQAHTLFCTLPYWQGVLNLMGNSKNPTELTGEVMNQSEFLQKCEETNDERGKQIVWSVRLQLAYYFGDMDLAWDMAKRLWELEQKEADTSLTAYSLAFFSALVSLELSRRQGNRKRRKYRKHALKCIKKMRAWVKAGAINFTHKLVLLQAEYGSLISSPDETKKAYNSAIAMAGRSGFMQDCALANERAGMFFARTGDSFWAREYLTRAQELYKEYGALVKADSMEQMNQEVFGNEST
eukprot:scaffold532450_cov102-Attheya_sp.AAC.1